VRAEVGWWASWSAGEEALAAQALGGGEQGVELALEAGLAGAEGSWRIRGARVGVAGCAPGWGRDAGRDVRGGLGRGVWPAALNARGPKRRVGWPSGGPSRRCTAPLDSGTE